MFWLGSSYIHTLLALQAGSLTYLSQRDLPRHNTEQQLKEIQLCLIVIDKTIPGFKKKKKNLFQENNFEIFEIPIKMTAYHKLGEAVLFQLYQ